MNIAIISDTHDHIDNVKKTLELIKLKQCDHLIALGDYCSPFTIREITHVGVPIDAVLGNNDGDVAGIILSASDKMTFASVNQEYREIELDGKRIAFCHYPKLANYLAQSGNYDAVFYGHTHIRDRQLISNTLLCNPGAVCGIKTGERTYDKPSFAIYNTQLNTVELVDIF